MKFSNVPRSLSFLGDEFQFHWMMLTPQCRLKSVTSKSYSELIMHTMEMKDLPITTKSISKYASVLVRGNSSVKLLKLQL